MIRPSFTDPRRDHNFSTTPTCWFGMWRTVSQAATIATTKRATRPARIAAADVPRAGIVPPSANTMVSEYMLTRRSEGWALRPEMNDGGALSRGPGTQGGRAGRLGDGVGLGRAPVHGGDLGPGVVSGGPFGSPPPALAMRDSAAVAIIVLRFNANAIFQWMSRILQLLL